MNISKLIKRFLVAVCLVTVIGLPAFSQVTATWTGTANDYQWNNAANWSWTSGSGVPTAATDVVIHNIAAPIMIATGVSASCRNLTIDGGNSNQIEIGANSKLNVYGNIIQNGPHSYLSDGSIASASLTNSELVFAGSQPQLLKSVMLIMSKVRINKMAGNVVIDSFCRLFINDTLFLDSAPVNIGNAAKGNLEIRRGSLVRDVHGAATKLPAFGDSQIPPHIVCTQYPVTVNEEVSYIVGDIQNNAGQEQGINGTVLFPVGENDSSYTPVTITQTGTNTNAWNVHITKLQSTSCSNNPLGTTQTVKHGFNIVPLTKDLSTILSTVTTPATITMSYNATNSQDVPAGYSTTNSVKSGYAYDQMQGCWNKLTTSTQTGTNFKTMTVTTQVDFHQYAIGSANTTGIPGVSNDISFIVYPNPVSANATIKITSPSRMSIRLSVMDFAGRRLRDLAQVIEKGGQVIDIDAKDLPSGTYLLQVVNEEGTTASKTFVKQQ